MPPEGTITPSAPPSVPRPAMVIPALCRTSSSPGDGDHSAGGDNNVKEDSADTGRTTATTSTSSDSREMNSPGMDEDRMEVDFSGAVGRSGLVDSSVSNWAVEVIGTGTGRILPKGFYQEVLSKSSPHSH